jgi:hypothetical protein
VKTAEGHAFRRVTQGRCTAKANENADDTLGPGNFYVAFSTLPLEFLHLGLQLITALSQGRGYGEAGVRGLFSLYKITESLTHRFAVPPPPTRGRGLLSTDISWSDQNVQTPGHG